MLGNNNMKPSLSFKKIWEDEDMVELAIEFNDEFSKFHCNTYVAHDYLTEISEQLNAFKEQVYGGLYDLRFGEFGPEYANGAFHARFEFHNSGNGKLFITAKGESEWEEFTHTKVASNSILYLKTEPALLDNWLKSLHALSQQQNNEANLECIL